MTIISCSYIYIYIDIIFLLFYFFLTAPIIDILVITKLNMSFEHLKFILPNIAFLPLLNTW